jgi:cytosine/adenosine deaminase-related metal-dependent hydrolase
MTTRAITNGIVVTMNPERMVHRSGTVVIEDDQIAAVGPTDETDIPPGVEVLDARGCAVLPGFVNAHTHVPQILLRGGASHDRGLLDWLFNVLYPGLAEYSASDLRVGTLLYCAEAIRAGITTVVDNEDAGPTNFEMAAQASIDAFQTAGLRTVYARMFFDLQRDEMTSLVETLMAKEPDVKHVQNTASTDYVIGALENLMRKYHGSAGGRIQVWPAPAIPLVLSERGIHAARKLAADFGTLWTMHVSEDAVERRVHWMSTPEYLHDIGALDDRLLAAHCVHIDDRDVRLLADHGVRVSTQAVSNSYLAAGIAPVPEMLARGMRVGMGTDDGNCNDSVNLISDMKVLALIHRATHQDASIITPEKVLEMATIDGARAIGLDHEIGSLEPGKQADVVLLDLDQPQMTPHHDLAAAIVFQAYGSEIRTVLIDGNVVMRDRELAFMTPREETAFYADAQERSTAILNRAGIRGLRPWRQVGT